MKRCPSDTELQERYAERDLQAKAATDAGFLRIARELLVHVDERTTRRWYRRKPERISPAG